MSHKIYILFPLLGLSCAQQFNHGMLPSNQGTSTSQEQGRQAYCTSLDHLVAEKEYATKCKSTFQTGSVQDISALANDPMLAFFGDVDSLLYVLHRLISNNAAFAEEKAFDTENTCHLLLNQLLLLEACVNYTCTSKAHPLTKLTLLQLAIQYNRTEIALKLINKFKEVNEKDSAAIINALGGVCKELLCISQWKRIMRRL